MRSRHLSLQLLLSTLVLLRKQEARRRLLLLAGEALRSVRPGTLRHCMQERCSRACCMRQYILTSDRDYIFFDTTRCMMYLAATLYVVAVEPSVPRSCRSVPLCIHTCRRAETTIRYDRAVDEQKRKACCDGMCACAPRLMPDVYILRTRMPADGEASRRKMIGCCSKMSRGPTTPTATGPHVPVCC